MGTNILIFYNNQRSCIDRLTMEQRGRLLTAIWDYEINGSTDVDDDIGVAFDFLRATVDADSRKYNEICEKNRENIKKRWNTSVYDRIRPNTNVSNINNNIDYNVNNTSNVDTNVDTNVDANVESKEKRVCIEKKASHFVPPTLTQVKEYILEKGLKMEAEHFYDHFSSNGWKVSGRATMKDWQAAVRNWARNEQQRTNYRTPHGTSVGERAYNMLHFEYEGHPEKWEEEAKILEELQAFRN